MKTLTVVFIMICSATFSQTGTGKSFLYLQNQRTDKIKKINLSGSQYIAYNVDSVNDYYYSYFARFSFEPTLCSFGKDSMNFKISDISYTEWSVNKGIESSDDWTVSYDFDTSHIYPYTDASNGYNMYLTHQSKAGRILFGAGVGIVYASLVNAFLIGPLRGLNAGSFNGYSLPRLWQSEFYSGIGLAIGLPIMLIFDHKDYYFQSPQNVWDTWVVTDEPGK